MDDIILDTILLCGGDINKMDQILEGENENENTETKYIEGRKIISETQKIDVGCPNNREINRD